MVLLEEGHMWWIKWKRVLATVFIPSLLTYMKTLSIFSACFLPSAATSCVSRCSPSLIFVPACNYKSCSDQCQSCWVILSPGCRVKSFAAHLVGKIKIRQEDGNHLSSLVLKTNTKGILVPTTYCISSLEKKGSTAPTNI